MFCMDKMDSNSILQLVLIGDQELLKSKVSDVHLFHQTTSTRENLATLAVHRGSSGQSCWGKGPSSVHDHLALSHLLDSPMLLFLVHGLD